MYIYPNKPVDSATTTEQSTGSDRKASVTHVLLRSRRNERTKISANSLAIPVSCENNVSKDINIDPHKNYETYMPGAYTTN
jgi:hypothetical protein